MSVRVRFAPSPTGALHIGGVRTALYNYLYAKKTGGKFILRIEDTDQTRYVEGAEEYIMNSLEWCGITPDEGPQVGGEYGPYRQSERKEMYKGYAQQLIDSGHAYYAFDTAEELDEMRERLKAARVASPQYNAITRMQMKNSLTLPEDEVKQKIEAGEPYVIRLKVPRKEEVRLNDVVRGWVMVHSSAIDDKVLMKSDGMPTYHLANVVDDHLMKITHVIRGEEWLPSAPLHVLLYRYLGWEETMPQFAHLPLILKPDGNGKLSKRDAEKHGFPIFPLQWTDDKTGNLVDGYKESGYLPDALKNFLALLGWSPGNNEEVFKGDELVEKFSLERIGKAGVKFDIEKAKWFNQIYLRSKPTEELVEYLKKDLDENNASYDPSKLGLITEELKERATFPEDFWLGGKFYFERPSEYDDKVIRKKWNDDVVKILGDFISKLEGCSGLSANEFKEKLVKAVEDNGGKLGAVMQPLRVSVSGLPSGPDLMTMMEILEVDEVVERIKLAIEKIAELQVK